MYKHKLYCILYMDVSITTYKRRLSHDTIFHYLNTARNSFYPRDHECIMRVSYEGAREASLELYVGSTNR